jgi:inward rectifier potassium channel
MAFIRKKNRDKLVEAESKRTDLGFGTQVTNANTRLINRDGTFNVKRVNGNFWGEANFFNRMVTTHWTKFVALVFVGFILVNTLFASLYYLFCLDDLHGANNSGGMTSFMEAFFFSAQTLTTVGYGKIAPSGLIANTLASIEALLGLLGFALATGILYGRFSRPTACISFSEKALISPYLDTVGFMFRMVNARSNQLIEVNIELAFSILETLPDGRVTRKYFGLPLERSKVNFFPISWTIVHPITEESPLWGLSEEELVARDGEFLILVRSTDDTFSQTVHARTSYHAREVVWGAKFEKMIDINQENGKTILDLSKLSDYERVPLATLLDEELFLDQKQVSNVSEFQ